MEIKQKLQITENKQQCIELNSILSLITLNVNINLNTPIHRDCQNG